ncbi:MAG TPA: transglycosylase SLT domain-containing protein [Patescibacteria group bacterium]|nr:transglycosylase SLT domain-containing protein [Patescibacteria group bacterium]
MGFKYFLTTALLLVTICTFGENDNPKRTYRQILKNKPNIDKKYATKLAKLIDRHSIKHKIPAHIYTAILMQESGYKLGAKRCIKKCTDFGISQINHRTAKSYNLDRSKLLKDLDYSIWAGAMVLADFKRYKKTEKRWWSRYNASSKHKRLEYEKLVKRYF